MVSSFTIASLSVYALVVASAGLSRGRVFALFAAVLLGVHTAVSTALFPYVPEVLSIPIYAAQALTFLHFATLTRPRMRPWWHRALITYPALWFVSATFLAIPWALASAFGARPSLWWLPFVAAGLGLVESLWTRAELVDLVLDRRDAGPTLRRDERALTRSRRPKTAGASARPLRIVQITDPHLGPFMSARRLRAICERAVAAAPDLVLLTGDFFTMESSATPGLLAGALAPLRDLEGRVFACFGNHDHEAPTFVRQGLADVGARLLVDEAALVETPAGPVQLLGFDFIWRDRDVRLAEVCRRHPRIPGALRLALLHDPGAFRHVPEGQVDLALSGHTHGGHVGLLTFGIRWTVIGALSSVPDFGLWTRGRDRLYVHRGTGHYGYPLRLGVPAEESVMQIHWSGE